MTLENLSEELTNQPYGKIQPSIGPSDIIYQHYGSAGLIIVYVFIVLSPLIYYYMIAPHLVPFVLRNAKYLQPVIDVFQEDTLEDDEDED